MRNKSNIKICFLFFITILFAVSLMSTEKNHSDLKKIKLIVKENQYFKFDAIEKIEKWGIVVLDNGLKKTILFKVIKTVTLYDQTYVNEIKKIVSNLNIFEEDGAFIISFEAAKIPVLKYNPKKIIKYQHITFNVRPDFVEPLEIGLIYSLWPSHSLKHRLSVSSGLPYSKNPSYHVMAFNYGIGKTIIKTDFYEVDLFMNYHMKILEKTFIGRSDFEQKDIFGLEISSSIGKNKRVFPSSNIRYYFTNVKIKEIISKLTILFGLNVKI